MSRHLRTAAMTLGALAAAASVLPAALLLAGPALSASAPLPSQVRQSWHGDQARVPAAQAGGRDGRGVVIAVLDSWVDRTHPDFGGRVLAGADCVGGTCRAGQRTDQCAHGTHVAGTVAASSYGVAPGATVLPVRVLSYDADDDDCVGTPRDVAAGVRWATASGARVINLSLGPDVADARTSTVLHKAVIEANRAGVVVVVAAGGSSGAVPDGYGVNALVVAATVSSGGLAPYSQRGRGVDLAAPGGVPAADGSCAPASCVTSLFPRGGYSVAAGTSMAAPHVSGVAALLLASGRVSTPAQVAATLSRTAKPLVGAGSGLLDATAALAQRPAAAAPPTHPARAAAPAKVGARATSVDPLRAAPGPPSTGRPPPTPAEAAASTPAPPTRPSGVLVEQVVLGLALLSFLAIAVSLRRGAPRRR